MHSKVICTPQCENAPPKMTLHPLTSKGGAFVLKLGLVFKITSLPFGRLVVFCIDVLKGFEPPSPKANTIGCLRSKRWAEPIESLSLRQNDESTLVGSLFFCIDEVGGIRTPLAEGEHNRVFA